MGRRKAGDPPAYREHRGKDVAYVTCGERQIYLGRYGTPESWERYALAVQQWAAELQPDEEVRPSGDPSNQRGYLQLLKDKADLDEDAEGYVAEALEAYRCGRHRTAAVLVGAAVEHQAYRLRVRFSNGLISECTKRPANLLADDGRLAFEAAAGALEKTLFSEFGGPGGAEAQRLYNGLVASRRLIAEALRWARDGRAQPAGLKYLGPDEARRRLILYPPLAQLFSQLDRWVGQRFGFDERPEPGTHRSNAAGP